MRSGDPVRQIADEAANGSYDLILISAEGTASLSGACWPSWTVVRRIADDPC